MNFTNILIVCLVVFLILGIFLAFFTELNLVLYMSYEDLQQVVLYFFFGLSILFLFSLIAYLEKLVNAQ